jgi:hypothetical protein
MKGFDPEGKKVSVSRIGSEKERQWSYVNIPSQIKSSALPEWCAGASVD